MSPHTPQADTAAMPHISWLGGWGIAAGTMLGILNKELPNAHHSVLPPTAASLEILRAQLTCKTQSVTAHDPTVACALPDAPCTQSHQQTAATTALAGHNAFVQPDIIAGYSTGAFLLLRDFAPMLAQEGTSRRVLLLAPFADFRMEHNLGGKVVSTRMKLLLRRLRSDPLAAVADFYVQSGIALPVPESLPFTQEDLIWGIEQLAQTGLCEENLKSLKNSNFGLSLSVFIGADDALLDADLIATLFAPGTCHIAKNTSHDLTSLLRATIKNGGLPQ